MIKCGDAIASKKLVLYNHINTQNDLFQIHIKIHIFEVSLGLISFESLDSLQLDVLNCLEGLLI